MKKQLFFIILLGVVELLAGCRPEGKEPETGCCTAICYLFLPYSCHILDIFL